MYGEQWKIEMKTDFCFYDRLLYFNITVFVYRPCIHDWTRVPTLPTTSSTCRPNLIDPSEFGVMLCSYRVLIDLSPVSPTAAPILDSKSNTHQSESAGTKSSRWQCTSSDRSTISKSHSLTPYYTASLFTNSQKLTACHPLSRSLNHSATGIGWSLIEAPLGLSSKYASD